VPRLLRIEIPGAYYHVVTRGNNKQAIFDDALRALILNMMERVAKRFDWRVYAWALMTNHYHFVFQIGNNGLSDGMCELNTGFARASNARFGRIDHCFGERFWSTHLETDRHLLESIRYATWNPARARRCKHPRDSAWTSFRASAGLDFAPKVLAETDLLELFGANPPAARAAFRRFVSDGRVRCQAPWEECVAALTSGCTQGPSRLRAGSAGRPSR
jgi:REP element-mobilizing transposase RayT